MGAPIVFFDIAGENVAELAAFYRTVLGWEIAEDGRFQVMAVSPLPATLRADPADKLLYAGVSDISATLSLVEQSGGRIIAPRFEVPGVVVLGLFADPAGNAMGLVELDGEQPKIP